MLIFIRLGEKMEVIGFEGDLPRWMENLLQDGRHRVGIRVHFLNGLR